MRQNSRESPFRKNWKLLLILRGFDRPGCAGACCAFCSCAEYGAAHVSLYQTGTTHCQCGKGIEAHTLTTLTDMIEEEIPGAQACVLSGPATQKK